MRPRSSRVVPARDRLLALAASILLASCASLPPGPDCDAARRVMGGLAAAGLFQGAYVIGAPGAARCEGAHGMADIEAASPFTLDTASDGASIAKTLTAAAILALAAEGRVDLEAPVRRYVSKYPHESTRVRHLLTHSAALPHHDWFDAEFGRGKPRSNADQIEALARRAVAPAFPPGSRFEYDNAAYDTAALVIERAAGMSYADFLRTRFFEPLGMRSAFVRPGTLADFPGERTRGYRRGGSRPPMLFDAIEGEDFHGASNVYLSARDLQAWVHAFASDSAAVRAARRDAADRARLDDGRETGLSLSSWYSDDAASRHYYVGDHQGFYCFGYWDAQSGRSVAFVANLRLSPWLKGAIPRALVAIGEGRPAALIPEPPSASSAGAPAPIDGTWSMQGVGTVAIRREGRKTYLRLPSGVEYPMYAFGGGWHATPGLDAWIHHDGAGRLLWSSVFRVSEGRRP